MHLLAIKLKNKRCYSKIAFFNKNRPRFLYENRPFFGVSQKVWAIFEVCSYVKPKNENSSDPASARGTEPESMMNGSRKLSN